jgi:hypothetical protein
VPEACPEFSAATDPLIASRVAWLPKHLDPFGIYRPQANRFDGKSDGKILFAIRCQIFTVKLKPRLPKSLQIKGSFAFQIVRLGDS